MALILIAVIFAGCAMFKSFLDGMSIDIHKTEEVSTDTTSTMAIDSTNNESASIAKSNWLESSSKPVSPNYPTALVA